MLSVYIITVAFGSAKNARFTFIYEIFFDHLITEICHLYYGNLKGLFTGFKNFISVIPYARKEIEAMQTYRIL